MNVEQWQKMQAERKGYFYRKVHDYLYRICYKEESTSAEDYICDCFSEERAEQIVLALTSQENSERIRNEWDSQ